jgi:hypothetical protein
VPQLFFELHDSLLLTVQAPEEYSKADCQRQRTAESDQVLAQRIRS